MPNNINNRFKGLKNKCCGENSKSPNAITNNPVPANANRNGGNGNGNGNGNGGNGNGNGNGNGGNGNGNGKANGTSTGRQTNGVAKIPRGVVPSYSTQPSYYSSARRYNTSKPVQAGVQSIPVSGNSSKSYYTSKPQAISPVSGLSSSSNSVKSRGSNNKTSSGEISVQKNKSNNNTSITSMNTNNGNNGNINLNEMNGKRNGNSNKSITNKSKNLVDKVKTKLLSETGKQILIILVVAVITFVLMYLLRKWILSRRNTLKYAPYLIEGSKSGKSSLVVSTNPKEEGSIPLYRSDGQDGAEFTYSFWMVIESMEYNFGKWKHIFHRGNKTSFPNRAPGLWIHPESNTIRVYLNTYNDPLEYVDIENIPIRKWFHCCVILNHKYLDIYFNGKLRNRRELKSAPRQNYGSFWSGLFGGFEGYLSKVRYYNKALEYDEIENIVKAGPSKDACGDTGDYPPYLDDDWWFDTKV